MTAERIRRARDLRRMATPAEAALWRALRNRGLFGAKARRQMACGPFILDFAFWTERLAVEIDGDTHATPDRIAYDRRRETWLAAQGWRVLRFTNREVLGNVEGVLEVIAGELRNAQPGPENPHPGPENPHPALSRREREALTPALSQRERENVPGPLPEEGPLTGGEGECATLPLPLGEGRGEGECR